MNKMGYLNLFGFIFYLVSGVINVTPHILYINNLTFSLLSDRYITIVSNALFIIGTTLFLISEKYYDKLEYRITTIEQHIESLNQKTNSNTKVPTISYGPFFNKPTFK